MKRKMASYYLGAIREGDRNALSRAISIVESNVTQDEKLANDILSQLSMKDTSAVRLGITGAPGVGKSTFIEAFGREVIDSGHRLAILAVDPSSPESGGSILGDKTRMLSLTVHPDVYIRPSASLSYAGGVNPSTYKSILLCEAAGFDYIIIETVGVGQSEFVVRNMVDYFLLLVQPAAGDELQGIKKGVMEMANGIAVNKCDGELIHAAELTKRQLIEALHYLPTQEEGDSPMVMVCSAIAHSGIKEVYTDIKQRYLKWMKSGRLAQLRGAQREIFFRTTVQDGMKAFLLQHPKVQAQMAVYFTRLDKGEFDAFTAVASYMDWFVQQDLSSDE
ncbi:MULTISPECIES: methylmalonyl Co-A mutase-associated GTPase MeaB [Reichenbachiella]|uniref:methylmalonyl Co-A mutase-associated GTPase MeaB n=1 Tax=Reichenbachiella TaxID=156993 RepID=UPI000E6BC003|nr:MULTISPECIES: methylmalonyl Co-A mutase-associated GTPase MeaB [Reichenbachiella]MBU2913307.1 methylmalonyl Co-A mutase-associated GTPase MeaB [Reichenbachiella agariperforans]